MKKMMNSIRGVTLLEIMLVLAIAAMVIVMSVRYYQSATQSQQANTALQMIQGITAAADGLAQGTGSFVGVDNTTLSPLMPNQSMMTPWGEEITVAGVDAKTYTVSIPNTPAAVCAQINSRLAANTQYEVTTTCGTTAAEFGYIYHSTPQAPAP